MKGRPFLKRDAVLTMRFGTVGTGWITEEYVKGALESGLWEYSAVYSRDAAKASAFSEKYGAPFVFSSIDEMASSDKLDAVYIASPNFLHYEQSKKFLEGGKHVICEKPLCSSSEKVLELQELAEKRGLVFLEAIMFMHLPQRKLLEEALAKVGDISFAKLDFCQRSSKLDSYRRGELPNIFNPRFETGALMDLGVYCVYPALYFFGEPESLRADAIFLDSGADSSGSVTLCYPRRLVSLTYSKTGQASVNSEFQGDLGTVRVESISRLANIEIILNDGQKESVCGSDEKYVLMGHEAAAFHGFIIGKGSEEYNLCRSMSFRASAFMERLRGLMHIEFK